MNLPVKSLVEQAVNRQVNSLVGDKDMNLNTIVKMSLLSEIDANEPVLPTINKEQSMFKIKLIKKEIDLSPDNIIANFESVNNLIM